MQGMVLGRVAERDAIENLLSAARGGRSGALVLSGDPGIGKSTLLDYAVERAGDMTVLRARGYESESEIPFAGLADLLHPVLSLLPALPGPQAAALQSALSLGPPVAGDRFSVCAATIGMLAAAAEDAPLLVIVDDLHWLDQSSREAILFAARRLHAEGIALLLASRVVGLRESDYAGLREIRLGGLERDEVHDLFEELAPGSPVNLRRQIYDDAAGNPLGIVELCRQWERHGEPFEPVGLTGAIAAGVGPATALSSLGPGLASGPVTGMPADSRITRALSGRLDGLPENCRQALLLAAASAGAERDVVLRAAQRTGLGLADFAPAEEAGLLAIEQRRIEFRHPLLRSVLYGSASTHARASAHGALAEVLSEVPGDGAADARAWHLAAARLAPDEETAGLLEAAGQRARHRGGYLEAARAFEQAAWFGEVPDRASRLLRAARCWQLAGRTGRVLTLMEEALPLAENPILRALIQHMDAYVRMWRLSPQEGMRRMVAAAEEVEGLDAGRAALMYADAGLAAFMLGRLDDIDALARRAYEVSEGTAPAARLIATVEYAVAQALLGRRDEARQLLADCREALAAADPLARAQEYAHAAFAWIWLEEYDQAELFIEQLLTRARAAGALGVLPQALSIASELYFRLGRWPEARAAAEESVSLAGESRQPNLYGQFFVARLDAAQGRAQEARDRTKRIGEVAQRYCVECMTPYIGHTLGLLALATGDTEEAVRQLEEVRDLPMAELMLEPAIVPWAFDLVEAYTRSGRAEAAAELLAEIAPEDGATGQAWAQAAAWRCRGLLAARDEMAGAFEKALAWHERSDQPFERARTLLCLGERLRRERQRAAARGHLRRALETFEQLGAADWAARARAELAATGETLTRGGGQTFTLTPQELQVAMVVARGASNSEAAAALFLSQKTIEYHLSNIYRKTELRSRADLAVLASAAT